MFSEVKLKVYLTVTYALMALNPMFSQPLPSFFGYGAAVGAKRAFAPPMLSILGKEAESWSILEQKSSKQG